MSNSEVVSAINGIGDILGKLVDRVVRSEKELVSIKSNLSKNNSSVTQKRRSVPLVVKVCFVDYLAILTMWHLFFL